MTITIAYYKRWRIAAKMVVAILALLVPPYITFWSFGGHFVSRSLHTSRAIFLIPGLCLLWIYSFVTLVTIVATIKQLVFDDSRAVWIDQGVLIFLRRWFFSVACNQIVRLSLGTMGRAKNDAIVVHLIDGREKKFPTGSLSEPRDMIAARLNAALNLPVAIVPPQNLD